MDWIIIPAREHSKGFPYKNRRLFSYTLDIIPKIYRSRTILTTDDMELATEANSKDIKVWSRKPALATDEANIKDVLLEVIEESPNIEKTDIIFMFYLTYPERTWEDVTSAYTFMKDKYAKSLLCREELRPNELHPFRYMFDNGNGTANQIFKNDLYRRQDYPKVFKFSHFLFMAYAKEIYKLNKNLWNKNTVFFPIENKYDIDTEEDFIKFKKRS